MIIPAYVKIIAALAVVAAIFGAGVYVGSLRGTAEVSKLKAAQSDAQRGSTQTALTKESKYEVQRNKAESDYLNPIPLPVVIRPVWVCSSAPPVHSGAVPRAPPAPSADPGSGSVQPGDGNPAAATDIRPDVDRFKERWEKVMGQCRLLRDSWPP